jgi:hypothetical protein
MAFSTFDIFKKNEEHINFIKEHGYDLDKNIDQLHPFIKNNILEVAILADKVEMVKIFIENKADINYSKVVFSEDNTGTIYRRTPLQLAVLYGRELSVKCLLDHKADISLLDMSNKSHLSILMLGATVNGAISGNCEVLKMLLEAKADIHQENTSTPRHKEKYMTALMYAAARGNMNAAIFLLDHGANIKNSKGKSVFEYSDCLTKKKIQKYISKHIAITQELQQVLNSLSIPKDLKDLICSYSRGASFEENKITPALKQPGSNLKETFKVKEPDHFIPLNATVEKAEKKINIDTHIVNPKKIALATSSPGLTSKIKQSNIPTKQFNFFKEKSKPLQVRNAIGTVTDKVAIKITPVSSSSRRDKCSCRWLQHTFFNIVSYVYPRLIEVAMPQKTNKKARLKNYR